VIKDNIVLYETEAYGGIRVTGSYCVVERTPVQTLVRGGRGMTALNQSSLDVTRTVEDNVRWGVSGGNGLRGMYLIVIQPFCIHCRRASERG